MSPPWSHGQAGAKKPRVFDPVQCTRLVNRWTVPGQPHAGALPARVGTKEKTQNKKNEKHNYDIDPPAMVFPGLSSSAILCSEYILILSYFSKKTSKNAP